MMILKEKGGDDEIRKKNQIEPIKEDDKRKDFDYNS